MQYRVGTGRLPQSVLVQEGDPSFDIDKKHSPNMGVRNVSEYLNDKGSFIL